MSGVFSAENTRVKIYRDDGTGQALGNALWEGRFVNTLAMSLGKAYEQIPHAGYVAQEVRLGSSSYSLQMDKAVESSPRDLKLTDALYYIEVEVYTDDRSAWSIYQCQKCRRISWELGKPNSGAYIAKASFVCENIEPDDQNS